MVGRREQSSLCPPYNFNRTTIAGISSPAGSAAMAEASVPLVPPLHQSSVYTIPDLDMLDRLYSGEAAGFIYARDGHPNAQQLADYLTTLEGGKWSLVCGSGMAAISTCLLPLLRQGDRIVASNWLYGRTTQLFRQELPRFA